MTKIYGPERSYQEATEDCLSSFPLLGDPYEWKMVVLGSSSVAGGGEGLFAKADIAAGGRQFQIYCYIFSLHEVPSAPSTTGSSGDPTQPGRLLKTGTSVATVLDTLKAHMLKKVKELELAAMPPYSKNN